MFDSSALMVAAAVVGLGITLAPSAMFTREMATERLVQPFGIEIDAGRDWLMRLLSRKEGLTMHSFRHWLITELSK